MSAIENLLDIRDEVAVARNFVVCVLLAAQSPTMPSGERAALCAVNNAARERLEGVERALDVLIANTKRGG